MADVRGDPWEHDAGPTQASGWAALFAETPNYRGLGVAVVGREAFRWHHGPMFYLMTRRDILQDNRDLIDTAIAELARHRAHPTGIERTARPGRLPLVVVHATHVSRIDARLEASTHSGTEQRWFASRGLEHGRAELDPEEILAGPAAGPVTIEIIGYDGEAIVARLRETLEPG